MNEDFDERTLRAEWKDRPGVGDTIQLDGLPHMVGEVVSTFYRNGEGGMHVKYAHGMSWSSCFRCTILKRAGQ